MTHGPRPTTHGLIGHPLGHSFSPRFFAEKFLREGIDAQYEAFPLEKIEGLKDLLGGHPGLLGLNVTTPHKQAVMPYLDDIDDAAKAIGAVNCIRIKSSRLSGYNTDWIGFRDSLDALFSAHHTKALVLGGGGASLAVRYALLQMNIPFGIVSREEGMGDFTYEMLRPEIIAQHPIIINTTTLGTEGQGLPLLPYHAITPQHLLYDLVYNPAVTPFLQEGSARGAMVKNGLEMLERQAEASWAIWQS